MSTTVTENKENKKDLPEAFMVEGKLVLKDGTLAPAGTYYVSGEEKTVSEARTHGPRDNISATGPISVVQSQVNTSADLQAALADPQHTQIIPLKFTMPGGKEQQRFLVVHNGEETLLDEKFRPVQQALYVGAEGQFNSAEETDKRSVAASEHAGFKATTTSVDAVVHTTSTTIAVEGDAEIKAKENSNTTATGAAAEAAMLYTVEPAATTAPATAPSTPTPINYTVTPTVTPTANSPQSGYTGYLAERKQAGSQPGVILRN